MEFNEQKLIEVIRPYYDKARAGDWEHIGRVVNWVKQLGRGRDDLDILLIAAYLHDIGWSGVAPGGKIDYDDIIKLEHLANANTSKFVKEVLDKVGLNHEFNEIIRLVNAADKHHSEQEDEAIVVDADNLSKLCLEHIQQKLKPSSYRRAVTEWEKELPQRIRTEKGKELYPKLLADLKEEINKIEGQNPPTFGHPL